MSDAVIVKKEDVVVKEESKDSEVVSKKAYLEVSKDMHTYKAKAREYETRLAELDAKAESEKIASLEEAKKFEELYALSQAKLDAISKERNSERSKFLDSFKINHVEKQLGGLRKSEYSKFLKLSDIKISEDGVIDQDSVIAVANDFRRNYPELISANHKTNLPNEAAKGFQGPETDVTKMSQEQLLDWLKKNPTRIK